MNALLRIFGAGPLGVVLSIASLGLAILVRDRYPTGALGLPATLRYGVLVCAELGAITAAVWSFRSLPVAKRGRGLCTEGAYRWVRHPLYASFITIGAPGLAVFLDHWAFLVWVVVLHALWHAVIPLEERLMLAQFGDEYRAYARHTGRFVPRLSGRRG
ncbi:MAG: isoprenylcysteine carboxylmethyltransferase family protein [Pirellulales bacterium]|nr:isoprenylcysteine carboxylmethyltransferase family protein [Pirellulales bacterium]